MAADALSVLPLFSGMLASKAPATPSALAHPVSPSSLAAFPRSPSPSSRRELDEGRVARVREVGGEVGVAQRLALVVLVRAAVDHEGLGAGDGGVGGDLPLAEQGVGRRDLEGRAGRIAAGDGPVEAEGRGVGRGQDIAGPHVDGHQGGRHVACAGEGRLGRFLDLGVEAELDVGAVGARLLEQRAVGPAAGGHAHPGRAGQDGVVLPLQAADPRVVAGDIPALALLHELRADGAVGAEQRLAERARARQRLLPGRIDDALQRVELGALAVEVGLAVGDHPDGGLAARLLGGGQLVHERARRLVDDLLERLGRGGVGAGRVELHRVDLAQRHEGLAVAVEEVAAIARGAGRGEPVARRELGVPVSARDGGLHSPAVGGLADAHGHPVAPRHRAGEGPRHLKLRVGGLSAAADRVDVDTDGPRAQAGRGGREVLGDRGRRGAGKAQLGLVERAALPGLGERLHRRPRRLVALTLLRRVSPPEAGGHQRHDKNPRCHRCYRAFPHGPIQQHVSEQAPGWRRATSWVASRVRGMGR